MSISPVDGTSSHLVLSDDSFDDRLVEHLLVPVFELLWFWNLLLRRMPMKYVIIALARRARPDMKLGETEMKRNRRLI